MHTQGNWMFQLLRKIFSKTLKNHFNPTCSPIIHDGLSVTFVHWLWDISSSSTASDSALNNATLWNRKRNVLSELSSKFNSRKRISKIVLKFFCIVLLPVLVIADVFLLFWSICLVQQYSAPALVESHFPFASSYRSNKT